LGWKGEAVTLAEFGDPLGSTSYNLCVYHVVPPPLAAVFTLLLDALAPAGGTCGGEPCWRASGLGYQYEDRETTPDGIRSLSLTAGAAGDAKITIKGRGTRLSDSSALANGPLGLPVTAQLSTGSQCWEATFASPSRNLTGRFKAKNR
jgi:hypothetical protein